MPIKANTYYTAGYIPVPIKANTYYTAGYIPVPIKANTYYTAGYIPMSIKAINLRKTYRFSLQRIITVIDTWNLHPPSTIQHSAYLLCTPSLKIWFGNVHNRLERCCLPTYYFKNCKTFLKTFVLYIWYNIMNIIHLSWLLVYLLYSLLCTMYTSCDKCAPVTTAWCVLRLWVEEHTPIWRVALNILHKQ